MNALQHKESSFVKLSKIAAIFESRQSIRRLLAYEGVSFSCSVLACGKGRLWDDMPACLEVLFYDILSAYERDYSFDRHVEVTSA